MIAPKKIWDKNRPALRVKLDSGGAAASLHDLIRSDLLREFFPLQHEHAKTFGEAFTEGRIGPLDLNAVTNAQLREANAVMKEDLGPLAPGFRSPPPRDPEPGETVRLLPETVLVDFEKLDRIVALMHERLALLAPSAPSRPPPHALTDASMDRLIRHLETEVCILNLRRSAEKYESNLNYYI